MQKRRSSSNPLHSCLLWSAMGSAGGLITLALALVVVISLVTSLIPGARATPVAPVTGTSVAQSPQPIVWTGQRNQAVVDQALRIAATLYTGPPDGYTTWYHAEQIPDAVAYWRQTCTGGCAPNWAQGNLQCTMLVTASYALAGQPIPFAGDAATWWSWHPYRSHPGWQEVLPTELPWPGDILIWDSGASFGGAGHIAVVVDVQPPDAQGQGGFVKFAQANGDSAIGQEPLTRDGAGRLSLRSWPGYTVLGYLRHTTHVR